ncbi:MAG: PKD domain-containing protein [Candidatus Peribacteria bacterium]|nr:MAG: PKD domain-containing protein [Candidatus Peribacteria bacterium]
MAQSDVLTINDDETWTIMSIPTKLAITIADIRPRSGTVTPIVELDGEPILSTNNENFSLTISAVGDHTLTIGVRDTLTNETSIIESHTIHVELPSIEGQLQVSPNSVGDEPFTVTLDASTVTLNDPDDEVVYFSWDFGDGEVKKNQSQGRIQHTYYFNEETQEGIYHPTCTITTRKGETMTLSLADPITIKRALRHAEIIFDSHPAQLANIGENVDMSLIVDGIPSTVIWDFGDGQNFQCTGRTCNEVTHNFLDTGTYAVSVTISYGDHPDVTAKKNIVIQ